MTSAPIKVRAQAIVDEMKAFGSELTAEQQVKIEEILAKPRAQLKPERQPRGVYRGLKRGRKPKVKL
jgi:hypothetical protein